jgi:hypothetical protein
VRIGLDLRRRLLDFADLLMPVEGALWDLTAGMQRTNLAGVLVSSGLADSLGNRSRDPRELAAELDLDPAVTLRLLRAANGARLVRFDGAGRASLSRLGAPLASAHSQSIASWVAYMAAPTNARAYFQLDAQVRGGAEPSGHRREFGNSVWEYFAEHPEEGARFGEAMREMTTVDVAALARGYHWPRRGVICDVAGGTGTLLAAILERRSGLRGILVDAPEVLSDAEGFLASRGLLDRVERRPGDMFGELDARADVYVLKWILHDWSDQACREILGGIRASMPSGARIVAIDQRYDLSWPNPFTTLVDLHMLVTCEGGRERTPAEVHGLMRDAGLKPGRVRHAGLHMLVEGIAS